jgi:Arylsulfatase A and related enzymes
MKNRTGLLIAALMMACSVVAQQKPNIILILADDLGFSDIGAYGGEIHTPNIDRLAEKGLRYKQFYNAARCCPTRASLLTGLYPHQAGMGWMAAADLRTTPAYQGDLNKQCVTIAEVLKTAGYSTYMSGKWHLTNERKIDGKVLASWPKQRGFDRYFGIIPGGANYFTPTIYSDNTSYTAPENFYLTHAISDTSVRFIEEHLANSRNPFFMYVAYTAPHWPLHALQQDIEKYKEAYKIGWDKLRAQRFEKQKQIGLFDSHVKLSPRDGRVPAWDELSPEQQNEMAMRMAIYAAQIDAMDQGIGKIITKLEATNQLDNTLIFFLSDNGACAEFISSGKSKAVDGTAETFESYRIHWANAGSTPFQQYKHYTHEGGIATPLIVHWPNGISKKLENTFVKEYGHLTDIMATCADVAKATYPKQYHGNTIVPMQGKSLQPHFNGKTNHRGVIYWEHEANIAMRDGKWKLVARTPVNSQLSKDSLELYDMEADPSEQNNLAQKYPDRVQSMFDAWTKWAESIQAFPLDTRDYGTRKQAYQRFVNGSFDNNLGGWNVHNTIEGSITVDTSNHITGSNSVMVVVNQPGDKPADLAMFWPFRAKKGEQFTVKLKAKANQPASFIVRVEKVGEGFEKIIDQVLAVSTKISDGNFGSLVVPEDGAYRIGLFFGKTVPETQVWVDDVELTNK